MNIEISPETYQTWVTNWYSLKHNIELNSIEEVESFENVEQLFVDFDCEIGLKYVCRLKNKPSDIDNSIYQVYSPSLEKDVFEITNTKKFLFALLKNQELANIYEQYNSNSV